MWRVLRVATTSLWWIFLLLRGNLKASLVAQRLKHLPARWETRVQSLGWEDPLEKEMVTHSSILAWRIPWMDVGNLIYGSSAFPKSNLYIWKFSVHVQLMPGLENFEQYFASV